MNISKVIKCSKCKLQFYISYYLKDDFDIQVIRYCVFCGGKEIKVII